MFRKILPDFDGSEEALMVARNIRCEGQFCKFSMWKFVIEQYHDNKRCCKNFEKFDSFGNPKPAEPFELPHMSLLAYSNFPDAYQIDQHAPSSEQAADETVTSMEVESSADWTNGTGGASAEQVSAAVQRARNAAPAASGEILYRRGS